MPNIINIATDSGNCPASKINAKQIVPVSTICRYLFKVASFPSIRTLAGTLSASI